MDDSTLDMMCATRERDVCVLAMPGDTAPATHPEEAPAIPLENTCYDLKRHLQYWRYRTRSYSRGPAACSTPNHMATPHLPASSFVAMLQCPITCSPGNEYI